MLKTVMQRSYLIKFLFRIVIFSVTFSTYIVNKDFLLKIMTHRFIFGISTYGITFLHVLWAVFMTIMICHLFPRKVETMAIGKAEEEKFDEVADYSQFDLLKFVQDQNIKAWTVLIVWLFFNAIWGVLYLFKVIDVADLLMITVFYFLSDYICILIYCPFQSHIMKNKCCVNCRIYDWGHFMMFTPMLFIKNFFSWSLFFTSVIVMLHWELIYAKHPERFWEKSNRNLQCANCKDRTCKVKRKITKTTAVG